MKVNRYHLTINGEIINMDGNPLEVYADHFISVYDFMYAVGYDLDVCEDIERGYREGVTGFYLDDNGYYGFDFFNAEVIVKEV